MDGKLRRFITQWTEGLLQEVPLSRRAPSLRDILNRKKSIDRTLGKVHPDLADGEVACILIYEILASEIGARYSAQELDNLEGRLLCAEPGAAREICEALVQYIESIPRKTLTLVLILAPLFGHPSKQRWPARTAPD